MRAKALIVIIGLMSACSDDSTDHVAAEAALRAANAQYDLALIEGDAAALNRFYADDFRIISDDAEISDKKEQIRFMTQEVDLVEARSDDVRLDMLGPDSALMTGRFTGRYRYKGEEKDFVERYTAIWAREGENWRLKHEHSSIQPKAVAKSRAQ